MATYLPDTNVLIRFGHDMAVQTKFENARRSGCSFLLGPPAVIELVRGMIRSGAATFDNDKKVFEWVRTHRCTILDLPRPFMANILGTQTKMRSGVGPQHYEQLIEMIVSSGDFGQFLSRSQTNGSAWSDIARADEIHRAVLDREFKALAQIVTQGRGPDLAGRLSRTFGIPGCRPNALLLKARFSAAIEFMESSLLKVRTGAKPRKNDPGLYVDFQLLLYLGAPDINFLTSEDFSHEIRKSPQKTRIVGLDSLS
jgi:hypothetical protein